MTGRVMQAGLLVLCAACAATGGGSEGGTDGEAALRATCDSWVAAFNANDAAAVAAVYTADAMVLPPNSEAVHGREAIEALWGPFVEGNQATLQIADLRIEGDLAYTVGTFEILGADGDLLDRGKYIEIWTRQGDTWAMHRDIFNSSIPAGE